MNNSLMYFVFKCSVFLYTGALMMMNKEKEKRKTDGKSISSYWQLVSYLDSEFH